MKNWITTLLCSFLLMLSFSASSQDDDEIVYFEDSRVKNSRMSLSLYGNPTYTDRRLLNDEIPFGGGYELATEDAEGAFQFNYGAQIFFSISSSLDVGTGFGFERASFTTRNAEFYLDENNQVDTSLRQIVDVRTDVSMKVVPIMLNFNTSISETFDLEVIPTVSLTFIDSYETEFTTASGEKFSRDFSDDLLDLNYQVGIGLGGTYYLSEQWGFFLRFNARYLLNNMLQRDDFPRETIYSFGSNLGFKFSF